MRVSDHQDWHRTPWENSHGVTLASNLRTGLAPHSSLCALQKELTKSLSPALRSGQSTGAAGWSEGRQKDRVWVVLVKKTGRCLFKDLITFSVMGSPGSLKCHSSEAMGCHTRRRRGLWDWEIWNRTASKPNLKAQNFHFALLVKRPSNQALMQCLFHSIKNQDLHKHLHAVLI